MKTLKELVEEAGMAGVPLPDLEQGARAQEAESLIRRFLMDPEDWCRVEREPHPLGERVRIWWGDPIGRKSCWPLVEFRNPGPLDPDEEVLMQRWEKLREVVIYYLSGGDLDPWNRHHGTSWTDRSLEDQAEEFTMEEYDLMEWESDQMLWRARLDRSLKRSLN
jgi:hypothetical protein